MDTVGAGRLRPSTPPTPASTSSTSSSHTLYQVDESPSSTLRRHKPSQDKDDDNIDEDDNDEYHNRNHSPSTALLSKEHAQGDQHQDNKNNNNSSLKQLNSTAPQKTVISIRILGILILISLFSWFYLEALAGGDIEWVKDHLTMLGVNLALSLVCITAALTLITITPMSRVFAYTLFAAIALIIYSLKRWDDGESFESHGAYNMLVFLVVLIPLNSLIQLVLLCQRKMQPRTFHRLLMSNVIGTVVVTTLMLSYYQSIWGRGALGARLLHAEEAGQPLCEWQGLNVPFVDLLPNRIQNFWAGSFSCPVVSGIEAEWNQAGLLTIQCLNNGEQDTGAGSVNATYDILPDTRFWSAQDKIMHTYNKKIDERIVRRTYTGPVVVDEVGVESIIAHCEEGVSKVLIRLVRNDAVLQRVANVNKAHEEMASTMEPTAQDENKDTNTSQTPSEKEPAKKDSRPNVLVLFMDAVARRQFYRKLAKTAAVVEKLDKAHTGGPQLHEFFRYHAVGFNTNANSAAIYTNAPDTVRPALPPIWKDFYEAGYITSRVEDNCEDWSTQYTGMATSQYFDHELQAPFCLPPYYPLVGNPFGNFDGPYSIVTRCLHGTNVHNHAFEYMNQFRKAYPDRPWFQMGSFIEGHEGTGEVLLTLDNDLARFFEAMEADGTLENTIILTMADHGLHMGINFMFTQSGRIEHILAHGLQHNQQSLLTGYEIHATLKMLASGLMPLNGDSDDKDGGAWRRGTLFDEELNPGRTCEEAKVPAWD
ncbi:hypothetical protein BGZ94_001086, partial [Podila epigama]